MSADLVYEIQLDTSDKINYLWPRLCCLLFEWEAAHASVELKVAG